LYIKFKVSYLVAVGVVLLGEFSVGLLDLGLVGVWTYPKQLIVILIVGPDNAVLERHAYQPHQNKGD